MQIFHNGTDSVIDNLTGDLYISNKSDDKDIIFRSDDGSGGFTPYFRLDGSDERLIVEASNGMLFYDNIKAKFGNSGDFQIVHNGSNTFLTHQGTGDLYIRNTTDDGDIRFQSDDGSGGVTEYLRLDGGISSLIASKDLLLGADAIYAKWGASQDLIIGHDGSNSKIENYTGHLNIIQNGDDKDIVFQNDDGSGGLTEYFRLDGGTKQNIFSEPVQGTSFGVDENAGTRVIAPGGAFHESNSASVTGRLVVVLPVTWTNTMMRFKVKVYDYTGGESFDVNVAGYNFSDAGQATGGRWVNVSAWIDSESDNDRNFTVKFGYNGSKSCITIGETTSTWSYVKFNVTEGQFAHAGDFLTSWDEGWSTDIITSDTGFTYTQTVTNTQVNSWSRNGQNLYYSSGTGNVGIGASNPTNKLTVNSGTTNVVSKFKSSDNQAWISVQDDDSGTYGALFGTDSDTGEEIVIANKGATKRFAIDSNGKTKLHAYGSGTHTGTAVKTLQVDSSGNIIEDSIVNFAPKVEYQTVSSDIAANTTITLPNSLTYTTSSGGYEYLEVFIDGIRLMRNIDFQEISTSSIKLLMAVPATSVFTFKSIT
jgi:hypothetical protein